MACKTSCNSARSSARSLGSLCRSLPVPPRQATGSTISAAERAPPTERRESHKPSRLPGRPCSRKFIWNSRTKPGITALSPARRCKTPPLYGKLADAVFAAMKANGNYQSAVMDLVLNGWAAAPDWTQTASNNSTHHDSASIAPYLFNTPTDATSPNEFRSLLAEPQALVTGTGLTAGTTAAENLSSRYSFGRNLLRRRDVCQLDRRCHVQPSREPRRVRRTNGHRPRRRIQRHH